MGQGNADAALIAGLMDENASLHITDLTLTGMRGAVPNARRLPLNKLASAPLPLRRLVGTGLYQGFDLVHRLDLRLPPARRAEVLTIYDLAPLRFSDEGSMPPNALAEVRAASVVVCPSRFSAQEVSRWSGRDDIEVIAIGVDPIFFDGRPPSDVERRTARLPERWVLHTGGVTQRKNLRRLKEAWPEVRARFPDIGLLLCGPEDPRRSELFRDIEGVLLMGRVRRRELVSLMAGAAAVVVPSVYEGYGLPVQEAMAAGVPVVAMDTASLPEVAGVGAILVEDNAEALADGLIRALSGVDTNLLAAAHQQARDRSWARVAREHLKLYQRLLITKSQT
jgi:glycosyltransferase involved in cell wall biosynthesis